MKTITQLLSVLTITVATIYITACGQKNQNTNAVLPVYQNCINCSGVITGSEFFRSESVDITQTLQLNLSFAGSNNVTTPYYSNLNYGSPIIHYSGPVAVVGTLNISLGSNIGGCLIQPGTYTLSTLQAGTWSNSIVNSLRVQAYGPTNMILSIPIAQVGAKRYDQMGRLWTEIPQLGRLIGSLIVENVNGIRCYADILVN